MRRSTVLIVAVLVAVGGCVATGVPPAASPIASGTATPLDTAGATPSLPPAPASPSSAASGDARSGPPPSLVLSAGNAGAHEGRVGGWAWIDHGDASPFLPARVLPPIEVAAGTSLEAWLADGTQIASWSAAYARAEDEAGLNLVELGRQEELLPPLDKIGFAAPPPGDWVLEVSVWYSENRGSGAYYWHLIVVDS